MENEHEKPGYYAIIPAPVLFDEDMPDRAKLLYGVMSTMTGMTGYCFASNSYLMRLFGISERTLQNYLRSLKDAGAIRIEDGDGGSSTRKIYCGINPLNRTPAKICGGSRKNLRGSPAEICGDNKKEINNKTDHPPEAPQGAASGSGKLPVWKPERFEKFWNYYPRMSDGSKPARARAVKAWDKLRPDDTTIDQMATALQRQKRSEQWQRGIGIPYASSWINGRRWEDDYEEPEDNSEDEEDVEWL